MLPILYKYTSKGQVQQWQIMLTDSGFYTIEGIKDGKLTSSAVTAVSPKNIGRANETTLQEQIYLEAKAKHQKKLDAGYNEILTDQKKFFQPMLAFDYDDYPKIPFTVRTFVQPKLDGIRCILQNGCVKTRTGKDIPSCSHLAVGYYHLDGELYNHDLHDDFDKIVSLVRKTKLSLKDKEEVIDNIQYWVYDFPAYSDKVFSDRYKILKEHFDRGEFCDKFKLVPTFEVFNLNDLRAYHKQFLEQGYEGTIVRMDLGGYESKRSKQLLKYKDFIDEDFEVIEIEEGKGNRAGMVGNLVVKVKNNKTSEVGMAGTDDFKREVLKNKEKYIGKFATTKHFGYTKNGKLRFPTFKTFRDYE